MQREMTVSFADIEAAAARLAGHAIETPLMRLAFAMLKLVVGPGGSVGLAALLAGRIEAPENATIGLVLSGGNVDPDLFAQIIRGEI